MAYRRNAWNKIAWRKVGASAAVATVSSSGWSSVDIVNQGFAPVSNVAGNQTVGPAFYAQAALTVKGIRCYWKRNAADKTLNLALWTMTSAAVGVNVANVDVAVTASGVYSANFAAPFVIPAQSRFLTTMWEKSGLQWTGGLHGVAATFDNCILGMSQTPCAMVGPYLQLLAWRAGGANSFPNANASALGDVFFPVEPIFA